MTPSIVVDSDFFEVDTLRIDDFWTELWVLDIEPAQGVVIILHSGETNALFWKEAQRLYKNGFSVVVSYTPKSFIDQTTPLQHLQSQTEWLRELHTYTRNKLGNAQIHLYGFELGAQAILQAYPSLYPEPRHVILHDACSELSTLYSIVNQYNEEGYWKFWIDKKINSVAAQPSDLINDITVPVLFISSNENNAVFSAQTTNLHNHYKGTKQLVQFNKSGHGSIAYNEADAWEYFVTNFLKNQEF